MNKFGIGLAILAGVAGAMVYKRYKAARDAVREVQMYEEMDAGLYFEEESR